MGSGLRAARRPWLPWVVAGAVLVGTSLGVAGVLLWGRTPVGGGAGPPILVGLPLEEAGPVPADEPWSRPVGALPAAGGPPLILDGALFERAASGFLPTVAPDGRQPRAVLRRRAAASAPKRVAILMLEIGLDEAASARALAFPQPLTLVVSAYADPRRGWYRAARWAGHDTLLELPTRPLRFPLDDAGPLALVPESPSPAAVEGLLARGIGYPGVAADAGAFAVDPARFAPVAAILADRGLALVELGSAALAAVCREQGLPRLHAGQPIDADPSSEAIDAALAALEAKAAEEGSAIGFGRPSPSTIDRLARWASGLAARGTALVGVGELLEDEAVREAVDR